MTFDVIIVGGGAIGAACAYHLARGGRRVLVLERGGTIGQAWRAAAGMLAPQIEAESDGPLFRLGVAAREHYHSLAPALGEATGIDVALWQEGIVQVARTEAEAGTLQRKVAWQRGTGQQCTWLEAAEVRARWPWLAPTRGAFWAQRDGALHPERLVRALLEDAKRHGAEIVSDTITRVLWQGDSATGVEGTAKRYHGAEVVIAAGAWSPQLSELPTRIPVVPVRGQMAALPWPEHAPRGIVYSHDGYLVAREGEAIVGSTMEHAGFEARTTPTGIETILTAAARLSPILAGAPRRTWAGLRPITPDGLPIVGQAPGRRGLWYATGHGRNGILLAGLTGLVMERLLSGQPAGDDVARCSPARFA
jgi:glycine oxidase